jgi:lipopolysaccharide transport system permease protein
MRLYFPADLLPWGLLIRRLTKREIQARYRGSMLGLGWTVMTPLLTLAVYTFVFSVVFQSRWTGQENAFLAAALNIFAGLITFGMVSESVNVAPSLVLRRRNFVTKVVFPLHILAVVNVGVAAFHALTSLLILICFQLLVNHFLPLSLLWLPLVWLPLLLGLLALGWLLSSLGVFLRDLSQIATLMTGLLMFLSAVFYPVSSLSPAVRAVIRLNPIAIVIEQTRRVVIEGQPPDVSYLVIGLFLAWAACEMALRFFQRTRRDFADVI